MPRILVGVSGGVAAYKAVELVRRAGRAGHAVRVVMTEDAERFVGRATFAAITGAPVLTSSWEHDPARGAFPDQPPPAHAPISHLALVANADVFVIAPATANTLARLAHGLADSLLTEAALAATCPLVVAPAMNDRMWEHPATRTNVALLRERGVHIIEPGVGELASRGEYGAGRLAEPGELLAAAEAALPATGPLEGLRVLVTAGGTREPIDAVRYVGNRSSGRMGWALAEEAVRRGAQVRVLAANVALPRRPGITYTETPTARALHDAALDAFEETDVLLMAAAVADFRPTAPVADKLKKDKGAPRVELEPTADVLLALGQRRRPDQFIVGFAAEHGEDGLAAAREKLRKRLDLLVVNDVARADIAFDAGDNEVWLLTADGGEHHVPKAAKAEVARVILDEVVALRRAGGARRQHV